MWDLQAGFQNAPVTVILILFSIILHVAVRTEALQVQRLYFSRKMILQHRQYWRLITSMLYFGELRLNVIFFIVTLCGILMNLESTIFARRRLEYIFMLLFSFAGAIISSIFTDDMFFGPIILSFVIYYWGKLHTEERVVVYGIPIPANYAPFVSLGFDYMNGGAGAIKNSVIGMLIGHVYFYLHNVLTARYGLQLLRPPRFLRKVFNEV